MGSDSEVSPYRVRFQLPKRQFEVLGGRYCRYLVQDARLPLKRQCASAAWYLCCCAATATPLLALADRAWQRRREDVPGNRITHVHNRCGEGWMPVPPVPAGPRDRARDSRAPIADAAFACPRRRNALPRCWCARPRRRCYRHHRRLPDARTAAWRSDPGQNGVRLDLFDSPCYSLSFSTISGA